MVAAQSYRALNWWLSFHGAREMLAWSSDAPSLQNNFIRVTDHVGISGTTGDLGTAMAWPAACWHSAGPPAELPFLSEMGRGAPGSGFHAVMAPRQRYDLQPS